MKRDVIWMSTSGTWKIENDRWNERDNSPKTKS